jgi:hypothetical protein
MKSPKLILTAVIFLCIGALAGWNLRPVILGTPSVPLPEHGGSVDYGFNAQVTWYPESYLNIGNKSFHKTTWKWVFHNRSDAPIQFSIPRQKIHLLHSVTSRQFIDIPDSLIVEPAITIAPGEKREFNASSGGDSWDKTEDLDYGFEISAKIDDQVHILGCAATVKKGTKEAEQASSSNGG